MDKQEQHKLAGKLFIIIPIAVVVIGLAYGLWHDFTPEYEATHKYGPPQWVYDEATDTVRPYKEGDDYPELIFTDEYGRGYSEGEWKMLEHGNKSQNFVIQGNKVIALTPLNEEQLKIQKEQGCTPCHPK